MTKYPRIGLALGAGGARGLVHLGVIEGLKEHHIPIHLVTGSSMGALVGAMYAATEDVDWMKRKFRAMIDSEEFSQSGIGWIRPTDDDGPPSFLDWAAQYVRSKVILNFSDSRSGIVKNDRLRKLVRFLLPVQTFDELKIPFACAATDLNSGERVILDQGDLIEAVTASACIPGYIMPVERNGRHLIDGAISSPVPGNLARELGANFVIAISAAKSSLEPLAHSNIVNILGRVSEITVNRLIEEQGACWDIFLHPDTRNVHWTHFELLDSMVSNGKFCVEQRLDDITSGLKKSRSPWGRLFRF